jgi:hypothetical protein
VQPDISEMGGAEALPRDNGELMFAAPWEGRALAMAIGTVQSLQLPWDSFRACLVAEIAEQSERPYYECWLFALERLLRERGVLDSDQLRALAAAEAGARSDAPRDTSAR